MFITGGLPFNLARNPNYRAAFNFVANNKLGGYVPPGYNFRPPLLALVNWRKWVSASAEILSTYPLEEGGVAGCCWGSAGGWRCCWPTAE